MTKALEEHLKEVEQKRGRISELEKTIKENEAKLTKLQEEYKMAVINDADNVDDLYHESEELQKKLKADKHKLKTLKSVTEDHLRKSAVKVLEGFYNVKPKYQGRVEKVKQQIEEERKRHKEVMAALIKEGLEINEEYTEEASKYWNLIHDHNIQGVWKKTHPHPAGMRPDLDEKDELAQKQAEKEGKLIPNRLYTDIERAASGDGEQPFSMRGEV